MFIISKKNLVIQRPGREPYRIAKDFVGSIPEDVAAHWMVQAAIQDGTIATPEGKKDPELERSDQEATERGKEFDIRPDVSEENAGSEEGEADGEPEDAGGTENQGKETKKRNSKK